MKNDSEPIGVIVAGSERVLDTQEFNEVANITSAIVLVKSEDKLLTPEAAALNNFNVRVCGCSIETLLQQDCTTRNFSDTLEIIKKGRPTPEIIQAAAAVKKLFRSGYYYKRITWLTGCEATGKLYCWPCLLFNPIKNTWNDTGSDEFGIFARVSKRHGDSRNHIKAAMTLEGIMTSHFPDNKESTDALEKNKKIKRNIEAVERLIDVVGSTIKVGEGMLSAEELLKLAGVQWETPLHSLPNLHADATLFLADTLIKAMKKEISNTLYVSLLIDELPDKRISIVFRFVDYKGEIAERFVGFQEYHPQLNVLVEKIKKEFNIYISLVSICLGRSTNSDTLTSGDDVVILHSPAFRISQVLPSSLQHIKECIGFFQTINGISKWVEMIEEELIAKIPQVKPIWWKERLVETIHKHKTEVQDVLQTILEMPLNSRGITYTLSMGIQQAFTDVEFCFLLAVFGELMPVVDALQDMITNNSPDTKYCVDTLKDYVKVINWKKENFEEIWESAQESDFVGPASKKPRHANSSRIVTYYRTLYETIVNTVVRQVELRFSGIRHLAYAVLLDQIGEHKNVDERLLGAVNVVKRNPLFDVNRLRGELAVAYSQEDFAGKNVETLLKHLYQSGQYKTLELTSHLCRLFLTIPYASRITYENTIKFHLAIASLQAQPTSPVPPVLKVHHSHIDGYQSYDSFKAYFLKKFILKYPNIDLKPVNLKTL